MRLFRSTWRLFKLVALILALAFECLVRPPRNTVEGAERLHRFCRRVVQAHAHLAAAASHDKGDHLTAHELSKQAHEHSRQALEHSGNLSSGIRPANESKS